RELRLPEASLNEGRQSEGPDGRARRVAGDRYGREAAVEVEPLVEAEIEILSRRDLIRKRRKVVPPRSDGHIGREGLVIGRIDILQSAGYAKLVEIGVGSAKVA